VSTRDTGGPAFPQKEPLTSDCHGMTLRDYFAAKAMQALMNPHFTTNAMRELYETNSIADAAYEQADAMLEARQS
jgi:hypothetical protein